MRTTFSSRRHSRFCLRFCVLALFVFAGTLQQRAQTGPQKRAAAEYENLPLNSRDFRLNMRKSELIVKGRIIDYKAPLAGQHTAGADHTTILVSETYVGSIQ